MVDADDAHNDLLRAVERFAQILVGSGMPRMAARVFAYVLAEDSDRYTAADLAAGLRVSPAAISGALRYLVDTRLVFKEREPGTRADLYRIYDDDVWSPIMNARIPMLEHYESAINATVTQVGAETRGGQRLAETAEFFKFIREEMTDAMARWPEHRNALGSRAGR